MLVGWGNVRYGWFGVHAEYPTIVWLNYISIFFSILSTILLLFIDVDLHENNNNNNNKNNDDDDINIDINNENTIQRESNNLMKITIANDEQIDSNFQQFSLSSMNMENQQEQALLTTEFYSVKFLDGHLKHTTGVFFSVVSGIAFGLSNTPVLYVMDNYKNSSQHMADYTYSLSCGILFSSLVYFLIYCAIKKKNIKINSQIFLPSLCTGKNKYKS